MIMSYKTLNIMNKNTVMIIIMLFFLPFGSAILSQTENLPKDSDLATPRQTVYQLLANLQEDDYNPALAAKTLNLNDPESEEAQKLAVDLKRVLDGKALWVDIEDIPDNPDYTDTITGSHKYTLFAELPNIYLKKYGNKWLFSSETVNSIPALYKQVYPYKVEDFLMNLPDFFRISIMGLYIWQYIAIVIYVILGFIFYKFFSWLFGYFLIKILSRNKYSSVIGKYITPIARPLSLLLILFFTELFRPVLELPLYANMVVDYALKVLIPFVIASIAYRSCDLVGDILDMLTSKTKTTVDDNLVPLVTKTLKIIVIAFGGIFILQNLEVSITPLLAGVSIGGLALALAAQDTVKNFFGSVTIFADQPFEVGDWIVFDGSEGTVEEVGVRSSRIRTFYNSVISIPNGKLADIKIDNMGKRQYRRFFTRLSITYDTPPDLIEAFVEGLRKIVEIHPYTRKDYYEIHLNDFNSSSLDILFYIFFTVPTWSLELKSRQEVMLDILRLAESLGVRFAFPTSTLHVENFPGKATMTPVYKESKKGFMKKIDEYFAERIPPSHKEDSKLAEKPAFGSEDVSDNE